MVNQYTSLSSDTRDWTTIPFQQPPGGIPVVAFDYQSVPANSVEVIIPGRAGYQIQLSQVYVYFPNANPSVNWQFSDALGGNVVLILGPNTADNTIHEAGTFLLPEQVSFEVGNGGTVTSPEISGWVSYNYVPATISSDIASFNIPSLAASSVVVIATCPANSQLLIDTVQYSVTDTVYSWDSNIDSTDGINNFANINGSGPFNTQVTFSDFALYPGAGIQIRNLNATATPKIQGWIRYKITPYPPTS